MSNVKTATCHCGAVVLNIELPDGLAGLGRLRRCNCSLCRRKGAIIAMVPLAALKVVKDRTIWGFINGIRKLPNIIFAKPVAYTPIINGAVILRNAGLTWLVWMNLMLP